MKLTILLTALIPLVGWSQDYSYFISTDTIVYEIGDNIPVIQEWGHRSGVDAPPPVLPDKIGPLEKISEDQPSKKEVEEKLIYTQKGSYTCFDTGFYQIPGIAWKVGNDSVISNPLILHIKLVEIDTSGEIKDIEPPLGIPYTLKELLPVIAVIFGLVAILILIVFVVKRKKVRASEANIPLRPAYIIAFEKLERLKQEKLYEQGMVREYHFRLSLVLREYIQGKYRVTTQELTTDELRALCDTLPIEQNLLNGLFKILQLGDLAKFAKANPGASENENAWNVIYDFISVTQKESSQKPENAE